jgi:hypothetical protein
MIPLLFTLRTPCIGTSTYWRKGNQARKCLRILPLDYSIEKPYLQAKKDKNRFRNRRNVPGMAGILPIAVQIAIILS